MKWLRNALAVTLLSTGVGSQISSFGYDENPSSSLLVTGDPLPKPKLGTQLNLEWMFDLWFGGWSGLIIGPDTPVRANICWHSNHPNDMMDKWLLVAPMWHIGNRHGSEGWWNYTIQIPNDPALVGKVVIIQAFYQADEWVGGTLCSRFRATNALRIQFMSF